MKTRTMALLRSIMLLSLEVFLIMGGLALCLFIENSTGELLGLTFLGIGLTCLGGWLYQGGSGHFIYHILLYPLVALVLFLTYQAFGLILSLLITGLYYWRIQFVLSNQFKEQIYLQRFFLAGLVYAACLIYFAIIHRDVVPIFWQLSVLAGWYLMIRWGESVTREQKEGLPFSGSAFRQYLAQVASAQILLTAGYLISAGAILSLFYFIWQIVKKPLGHMLAFLTDPIVALIMTWMEKLSGIISKNKNAQNIISNAGSNGDLHENEIIHQGPSLIERMEPYLIAGSLLIFAGWLGYTMWRRRHRSSATGHNDAIKQKKQTVNSLNQVSSSPSLKDTLHAFYQRFKSPEKDVVRQQYDQFLRHMASLGLMIEKSETPSEFLNRIRSLWRDPEKLRIAQQITVFYERHRYDDEALSSEEIQQLTRSMDTLRKLSH